MHILSLSLSPAGVDAAALDKHVFIWLAMRRSAEHTRYARDNNCGRVYHAVVGHQFQLFGTDHVCWCVDDLL
jgi:hypothetical protein